MIHPVNMNKVKFLKVFVLDVVEKRGIRYNGDWSPDFDEITNGTKYRLRQFTHLDDECETSFIEKYPIS